MTAKEGSDGQHQVRQYESCAGCTSGQSSPIWVWQNKLTTTAAVKNVSDQHLIDAQDKMRWQKPSV
jgi:hypothetical protein